LRSCTNDYSFSWVGDDYESRHKGDVLAVAADGTKIYIEVKNDSRIAETHNVLLEEENYFKANMAYVKGNLFSDY
jgi:hypothetical protein